jgi:uncharacterized FlgJ-related protein
METSQEHVEKRAITIRDLYPTLTEQELKIAEENFRRYIEIAMQVQVEQLISVENGGFDSIEENPNIKERSNSALKS